MCALKPRLPQPVAGVSVRFDSEMGLGDRERVVRGLLVPAPWYQKRGLAALVVYGARRGACVRACVRAWGVVGGGRRIREGWVYTPARATPSPTAPPFAPPLHIT